MSTILCPACEGSGVVKVLDISTVSVVPAGIAPDPEGDMLVTIVEAPCATCGGHGTVDPRAARDALVTALAAALVDETDGLDQHTARHMLVKLDAMGWLR